MITVEILKPANWQDFETLCHSLYGEEFNDMTATRNGRPGQEQFGVDVFAKNGTERVGVQCKRYNKISYGIVEQEILNAEKSDVKIDLLIIATTADNDAKLVSKVINLSDRRQAEGKFPVKIAFWDELQMLIQRNPKTARVYAPSHPSGMLADVSDQLSVIDQKQDQALNGNEEIVKGMAEIKAMLLLQSSGPAASLPSSSPPELNRLVTRQLDDVRDAIRTGRTQDALRQLEALGEEKEAFEPYNRFRWHTSYASCLCVQGDEASAAEQFLEAFRYAPEDERALANRARAFLLKKDVPAALRAASEGIARHPDSGLIWSVKLNAQQLAGTKISEKSVPARLRRSADVLHVLAWGELNAGNPGKAFGLVKKARAVGPDNMEFRRLLLASAVAWATQDPVKAHLRLITAAQQSAVREGLGVFEPLEAALAPVQDAAIRRELANNGAIALALLHEENRVKVLVEHALASGIFTDGLQRLRLLRLDEENRFDEIRALCEPLLQTLSNEILLLLLEIALGQQDFGWYGHVRQVLGARELNDRQRLELAAISANAIAAEHTPREAVDYILAELGTAPKSVMLNCVAAFLLRKCDDLERARKFAQQAGKLAMKAKASHEIHMTAELLYELEEYAEAAPLYARLLVLPGDNAITYRLIVCYLRSGQRARAQAVMGGLAGPVRQLPKFRRLEAWLLHQMGDWTGLRRVLEQEIDEFPQAIDIAIGYAATLYRLGDIEALKAYMASDSVFPEASIRDQMEFAKYQVHYGNPVAAIRRMYGIFRRNPHDTEAASGYLLILFLAGDRFDMPSHVKVEDDTAVELILKGERRWRVIEGAAYAELPSSADVLPVGSSLRKMLLGKVSGDHVVVNGPMGPQEYQVGAIESMFADANRRAHELIISAIEPTGPLFSVRVVKEDGGLDMEALHEPLKQRSAYVREVFDNYRKSRVPLSVLAALLKVDLVTLWLEWPSKDLDLFICQGLQDERDEALALVAKNDQPIVLDLVTLVELTRLDLAEPVLTRFGRPLVTSATMEQLDIVIQAAVQNRSQGVMQDDGGQLRFIEIPAEYHEQRQIFLASVKKVAETFCDVVPVVGPPDLPQELVRLGKVLDSATYNTLLLCAEREATLLSEDGMLRQLAKACGVPSGIWLQPVLMALRDERRMSQETYSKAILGMLAANRNFISFDARDLLWAAEQSPAQPNARVVDALKALEIPTLWVASGVTVGVEFIRFLFAKKFSWGTILEYLRLVMLALSRNRLHLAGHFATPFLVTVGYMLYRILLGNERGFPGLPKEDRCLLSPAHYAQLQLKPDAVVFLEASIGVYGQMLDDLASVLSPFFRCGSEAGVERIVGVEGNGNADGDERSEPESTGD